MSPLYVWMKKTYIPREMLCGHSEDIVWPYISRDICPHYILLRFSPQVLFSRIVLKAFIAIIFKRYTASNYTPEPSLQVRITLLHAQHLYKSHSSSLTLSLTDVNHRISHNWVLQVCFASTHPVFLSNTYSVLTYIITNDSLPGHNELLSFNITNIF